MLTTLDAAEKKVKDLQKHIDLGNKLVNTKQAKIAEVDNLQKQANSDSHSQAQDINKYAKLAKDDQDKSNEALKATFAQEPKPVEETTQQELQAEAEQASKIVEAERATSSKAQKTAEKLKPQVEDQETQLARLTGLMQKVQGGDQQQALREMKDQEEEDFSDMSAKYQKLVSQAAESASTASAGAEKIEKLQTAIVAKKEDDKEVAEARELAAQAPGEYKNSVTAHAEAGMEIIDYQDSVFKKQDKYAERVTTPKLEPQAPPPINSKKAEEPAAAAGEKAADVAKAGAASESGEKKSLAKEPLTAPKAKAPETKNLKDVKKSKKAKKAAKKPAAKKTGDDDEATAADEKAFFEEEKELQSMQNETQSRVDEFVKQQREAYEQKMEAALASYRTNVAKIEESFIKEEEEAAEKAKGFLKSRKKSNDAKQKSAGKEAHKKSAAKKASKKHLAKGHKA